MSSKHCRAGPSRCSPARSGRVGLPLPRWLLPEVNSRSYAPRLRRVGVLRIAGGAIWYPFFPVASRGNPADTRGRTTSLRSVVPAPVRSSRGQASRRPSPPRAPLPRRRVRRGCADPAPPAGPSGAAGSGHPLGTLRSPPRPRGGANRAGERVTPLFLLEPPGPVAQRT